MLRYGPSISLSPYSARTVFVKSFRRLIQFERQAVGVSEEGEALVGVGIDADVFAGDACGSEAGDLRVQVRDREGQMAQAAGFRAAGAWRGIGEGEKFDLGIARVEIALPGLAFCAPDFADDGKAERLGIEGFRPVIVGTDEGDVVDGTHGGGHRPPGAKKIAIWRGQADFHAVEQLQETQR